jgi:hypothetical protein
VRASPTHRPKTAKLAAADPSAETSLDDLLDLDTLDTEDSKEEEAPSHFSERQGR